jgi:hypothetical protein
MSLDLTDPSQPIAIDVHPPDWPVFAFFRVSYRPASPP